MGGLFSAPKPPPPPEIKPPAPMPDDKSPQVMAARRLETAMRMQPGTRASTILTTAATRPSGSDYSGSKLGG